MSKPFSMLPRIHIRNELARTFYQEPSEARLANITEAYELDFVVFTRGQPLDLERPDAAPLTFMVNAGGYRLYSVNATASSDANGQ